MKGTIDFCCARILVVIVLVFSGNVGGQSVTETLQMHSVSTFHDQRTVSTPDYRSINFGYDALLESASQSIQPEWKLRKRKLKKSYSSDGYEDHDDTEFVNEDFLYEFEDMYGQYIDETRGKKNKSSKRTGKGGKKGKGYYPGMSMDFEYEFSMDQYPRRSKSAKKIKRSTNLSQSESKGAAKLTRPPIAYQAQSERTTPAANPTIGPVANAQQTPTANILGTSYPDIVISDNILAPSQSPTRIQAFTSIFSTDTDKVPGLVVEGINTAIMETTYDEEVSVVEATDYEIVYNIKGDGVPDRGDYIELSEKTGKYLEEKAEEIPGRLINFSTEFRTSSAPSSGTIVVKFHSVGFFDSSQPVPTQVTVENFLRSAFNEHENMEYITMLQQLSVENFFASTVAINFNSQSSKSTDANMESSVSGLGIALGATVGFLVLSLSCCLIKRQNGNADGKNDGTVMGMTVASSTIVDNHLIDRPSGTKFQKHDVCEDDGDRSTQSSRDWLGVIPPSDDTDESTYATGYVDSDYQYEDDCRSNGTSVRVTHSFESAVQSVVRFALNSFERAWREDEIEEMSGQSIHSQRIRERWDGTVRKKQYQWQSSLGSSKRKVPYDEESVATDQGQKSYDTPPPSFSLSLSQDVKHDLETAGLLQRSVIKREEQHAQYVRTNEQRGTENNKGVEDESATDSKPDSMACQPSLEDELESLEVRNVNAELDFRTKERAQCNGGQLREKNKNLHIKPKDAEAKRRNVENLKVNEERLDYQEGAIRDDEIRRMHEKRLIVKRAGFKSHMKDQRRTRAVESDEDFDMKISQGKSERSVHWRTNIINDTMEESSGSISTEAEDKIQSNLPTPMPAIESDDNTVKSNGLESEVCNSNVQPKMQGMEFIAPWKDGVSETIESPDSWDSTRESGSNKTPDATLEEKERIYVTAKSMNKVHPDSDDPWWYSDERSVTRRNHSSLRRPHYSRLSNDQSEEEESEGFSQSTNPQLEDKSSYSECFLPR